MTVVDVNDFLYAVHPAGPFTAPASSGSGTIQVFEGRDPLPPDDPAEAALSFPVGGGGVTEWSPSLGVWI